MSGDEVREMRVRRRPGMRVLATALVVAASAAPAVATGGPVGGSGSGGGTGLHTWGEFGPPRDGAAPRAVTHDPDLVPPGARISVAQEVEGDRMVVRLAVSGLRPGHTYGTHVHTAPCGPDPDDSGGHYQDRPGDDPESATPENEVWLDFTADRAGDGRAVSEHDWTFRPGEAASVVIHEESTSTGEDGRPPGDAGGRAACLTVPFAGYGDGTGTGSGSGTEDGATGHGTETVGGHGRHH